MSEVNGRAATQEALSSLLRERLIATLANHEAEQERADDQLTDSLATDYIITRDFL